MEKLNGRPPGNPEVSSLTWKSLGRCRSRFGFARCRGHSFGGANWRRYMAQLLLVQKRNLKKPPFFYSWSSHEKMDGNWKHVFFWNVFWNSWGNIFPETTRLPKPNEKSLADFFQGGCLVGWGMYEVDSFASLTNKWYGFRWFPMTWKAIWVVFELSLWFTFIYWSIIFYLLIVAYVLPHLHNDAECLVFFDLPKVKIKE